MRRAHWFGIAIAALMVSLAWGQASPADTPASEADRANAYYRQGNLVGAVPLYEHLAAAEPGNPLFAERLAFCLFASLSTLPTGEERSALLRRVRSEAEHAKALGDRSNLLQIILDSLDSPGAAHNYFSDMLNEAEAAFNRGDLDGALDGYLEVAQSDPRSYDARLFAGDVYFRRHDARQAGEWFQKAIDVDPDRETAYRYWGDTLAAAGDKDAALQKFIDAVVAEPYARKPWLGLSQWARANGATLRSPHVPVPKAPEASSNDKSKVAISFDTQSNEPAAVKAAWLAYSSNRALWLLKTFSKRFPGEETYRHSLAEEAESLRIMLTVLQEMKAPPEILDDAALRDLVQLGKDGMIEPYILLNAADDGIKVDYAAYRASHREQLHAYMEKYVVHR